MGSDEGRDEPGREDREKRGDREAVESEYKTFVGGLPWLMKDEDLKQAFAKYEPSGASIILDKNTSRPRGFGFVFYKDKLGMEDAIRDMHEKELDGRRISVVRAVPQEQTKPGTPAGALGAGTGSRMTRDRYSDRSRAGDRNGGGRDSGRDRGYGGGGRGGGGDRHNSYPDPRYAAYDRGHSRDPYARDPYARDPYARDPHSRDPYARDPYARDPYARDPYARDPHAGRDPYGYAADPYAARGGGAERRQPAYGAPRPGPYDRSPRR